MTNVFSFCVPHLFLQALQLLSQYLDADDGAAELLEVSALRDRTCEIYNLAAYSNSRSSTSPERVSHITREEMEKEREFSFLKDKGRTPRE